MQEQSYSILDEAGEMGKLINAYDWGKTSLGPLSDWPETLKTAVRIMLLSEFPIFIYWGSDLICLYNDAGRRALLAHGIESEILGKPAADALDGIWHLIDHLICNVISTGRSVSKENMRIPLRQNGSFQDTYWTFSCSPITDSNNKSVGVWTTFLETTEKLKAFSALEESLLQLEFAIEAAELCTFDYNPATDKFIANDRLKHWFSLPNTAEIALPLALAGIVDEQREQVAMAIKSSFDPASNGKYEIEYSLKAFGSQSERRVLAKGRVFFNTEQKAVRLSGTLKDISQQVALRERVTFLAQVAEQSDDAIIAVKPDETIVSWNAGAVAMYGYSADEMVGKKAEGILKPMHAIASNAQGSSPAFENAASNYETQRYRKDGKVLDVSVTVFPVKDEFGTLLGIAGIARDITELKKIEAKKQQDKVREQQIIAREKLKAQEAERNQLGIELHDNICQVLAAVKMKLGFYLSTNNFDTVGIKDCMNYLEEALLETRDISHRMIMPRFSEISLADALVNLSNIYQTDSRTIYLTYPEDTHTGIPVSHKEALYRISQEQFNNMNKYSAATEVNVTISLDYEFVTLTIEDNGVGFDITKIKPGVGLANIRSRAELLNGVAEIISAPDHGCFLKVRIPLNF